MKSYGIIDMQKNEIENFVVDKGTSFPGTPSEGQMFYRTDEFKLYAYKNSAWAEVTTGGAGASVFTDLTDVPASYTGYAGKMVSVKGTEDGLEFVAVDLANDVTGTLAIANGGTGQTTASASLNALLPSQSGNAGKALSTDGSNTCWSNFATGIALSSTNENVLENSINIAKLQYNASLSDITHDYMVVDIMTSATGRCNTINKESSSLPYTTSTCICNGASMNNVMAVNPTNIYQTFYTSGNCFCPQTCAIQRSNICYDINKYKCISYSLCMCISNTTYTPQCNSISIFDGTQLIYKCNHTAQTSIICNKTFLYCNFDAINCCWCWFVDSVCQGTFIKNTNQICLVTELCNFNSYVNGCNDVNLTALTYTCSSAGLLWTNASYNCTLLNGYYSNVVSTTPTINQCLFCCCTYFVPTCSCVIVANGDYFINAQNFYYCCFAYPCSLLCSCINTNTFDLTNACEFGYNIYACLYINTSYVLGKKIYCFSNGFDDFGKCFDSSFGCCLCNPGYGELRCYKFIKKGTTSWDFYCNGLCKCNVTMSTLPNLVFWTCMDCQNSNSCMCMLCRYQCVPCSKYLTTCPITFATPITSTYLSLDTCNQCTCSNITYHVLDSATCNCIACNIPINCQYTLTCCVCSHIYQINLTSDCWCKGSCIKSYAVAVTR